MRGWLNSLLPVLLALLLYGCGAVPYSGAQFHPGFYVVKRHEDLYSIAWRFDLNYRDLAQWNGIPAPYRIYPGQLLRMNPPPNGYVNSGPVVEPSQVSPAANTGGETSTRSGPVAQQQASSPVPQSKPPLPAASHLTWVWPAQGVLSAGFTGGSAGNQGIDISGKLGEPVVAASAGQVVYSGDGLPSYGNLLIIQHNERYLTAYAHNQKLLVHEGDVVKQGQEIATMGRSGTDVPKPMLHFEIRVDGEPVDPLRYLPKQH